MRIPVALALALVLAFVEPAFGQSFVGKWTATADTPGGKVSETVTVVKTADGYAITAKLVDAAPDQPEAGPGTDIVLSGDNFSYKRTVSFPGGSIVLTYTGVVSGDTFTGKAELTGIEVPYNGVRIKDGG